MRRLKNFLLPIAFVLSLGNAAAADMLGEPTGPVVLTVSGAIEKTNDGDMAVFDRDMLRDLGWTTIEGYTRWTDGATEFAGVELATVLEAVGARGTNIVATALNDYSVEIPSVDAEEHNVLLALEVNGETMKIRDKGPIWVIYPQTEAQSEEPQFDEKMIWQLKSIQIID